MFENRSAVRMLACIMLFLVSTVALAGGGGPPKPDAVPEKVRFMFTAPENPENIFAVVKAEAIEIWPPANENNITGYNIYWGDSECHKLGIELAPRLGHVDASYDGSVLRYDFPDNLKTEIGAIYMLVCSENDGKENCGGSFNCSKTNKTKIRQVDLIGMGSDVNHVKNLVNAETEASCPGIGVMATCGDLICNGIETATSCPSDCSSYGEASFNYQTLCDEVQNVYHPGSVAEIQQIVNDAVANGQHIKVNGGAAKGGTTGSATDVICTDGVVISMDQINEKNANFAIALETFEGKEVVNVPAGTSMFDMAEWLHARGRSIGYGHLGWRYPTVAGHIGTSAHGSSPKHSNVVSQRVVSLDIVTPDGQFQTFSEGTTGVTNPDLWHAMTTHLGYFGVITGVRLAVEETKNLHVSVSYFKQSEIFQSPHGTFGEIADCDYGQYNWFPGVNRIMKTCGKETTAAAEPGANNMLLYPHVDPSQISIAQTMQAYQLEACKPNSDAGETMERLRYNGWYVFPPHQKLVNGVVRHTTDLIGPQHRMISSPLIDAGREVFQMDWEVAVPAQNLEAAMQYVKDWTNGVNLKNRNMPVPLIGIFVRYSKSENKALMAYTGTGGPFQEGTQVVHIELPIFVPVNLSEAQFNEYMDPYEEVINTLITQYGARAHWAKNQHSGKLDVFDLQRNIGSYDYDNRLQRFSNAVGQIDPNGVFANKFAKHIGVEYPNFNYPASW
jgi:FAD/FMN-containing dehydrogenase